MVGRLPMKQPEYAAHCLVLIERLLHDDEVDVKKAVSFAIRLVARGEISPVRDLLVRYIPTKDPAAIWVLCDVIRRMTKGYLPEFVELLPLYEAWGADQSLKAKDRSSIESAIKALKQVKA